MGRPYNRFHQQIDPANRFLYADRVLFEADFKTSMLCNKNLYCYRTIINIFTVFPFPIFRQKSFCQAGALGEISCPV